MTKYLMAALLVAVASTVLALGFPAEAQLQETTTANIDSRLAPEIERDGQIKVLISLRALDELMAVPIAEWTEQMVLGIDWDLRARQTQEVQANVRSALGPKGDTELNGVKTMPGIGANIPVEDLYFIFSGALQRRFLRPDVNEMITGRRVDDEAIIESHTNAIVRRLTGK